MPNTKMKITTIYTFLTILAIFSSCADKPNQKILTEEQQQQNRGAFAYVWTAVRDKHYDPLCSKAAAWRSKPRLIV